MQELRAAPHHAVPLLADAGQVARNLSLIHISTAIGEGIFAALSALEQAPPDPDHPDEPAPGAIVLLSDGYTNVGRPSELAAAEAKKRKTPIYTCLLYTSRCV